MQWLFEGSEEAPDAPGLGLLAGRCWRLTGAPAAERQAIKVPHVGWNTLTIVRDARDRARASPTSRRCTSRTATSRR